MFLTKNFLFKPNFYRPGRRKTEFVSISLNFSSKNYSGRNEGFQRFPRRVITNAEQQQDGGVKPTVKHAKFSKSDLYADQTSANFLGKNKFDENLEKELSSKDYDDERSIDPDEFGNFDAESNAASTSGGRYKPPKKKKGKNPANQTNVPTIFTTDEGIEWTYMEKNDHKFMKFMIDLKNRKKRDEMNKIILEGRRLITEALTAGIALHSMYFTDEEELRKLPIVKGEGEIYKISHSRMEAWSNLDTPPGVFAIFEKPNKDFVAQRQSHETLPVTVVLENLRDPGNMGSVLRALSAAGCKTAVVLKGCCDVWESKVLRGGMGAHFTLPIVDDVSWEYLRNYLPQDFSVFLADNKSYEIVNEAESFKLDEPKTAGKIRTNSVQYEETEEDGGSKVLVDKELKNPRSKFRVIRVPILEHFRANFARAKHIVLILGGETTGISNAAYHFVHKFNGTRCHIPMTNNVDSLNVAAAASVIIFEIKRQFYAEIKKTKLRDTVDPVDEKRYDIFKKIHHDNIMGKVHADYTDMIHDSTTAANVGGKMIGEDIVGKVHDDIMGKIYDDSMDKVQDYYVNYDRPPDDSTKGKIIELVTQEKTDQSETAVKIDIGAESNHKST